VLSHTAEYALKAVLYIAEHATGDDLVRVGDIAKAIGVPRNYLAKILHELARTGVLWSARGKHGGFRLATAAEDLPLLAIVSRFDHVSETRSCLLGGETCSDRTACALHWRWKALSDQLGRFFKETTVADLTRGAVAPMTVA
jgi:Rrf2 family protein